jgi:hypothetical protein
MQGDGVRHNYPKPQPTYSKDRVVGVHTREYCYDSLQVGHAKTPARPIPRASTSHHDMRLSNVPAAARHLQRRIMQGTPDKLFMNISSKLGSILSILSVFLAKTR